MIIGNLKSSYAADEAVLRSRPLRWGFVITLIALAAIPWAMSGYQLYLATQAGIMVVALVGLNVLTGYTGLISLGHGAMVGVGAYAAAIAASKFGAPIWVGMPVAVISTMLIGLLFGLPSLRIRGLYLTISTIAASFIILFVLKHWSSMTGGDSGVTMPPGQILGVEIITERQQYFLIIPIAVLSVLFAQNLFRTRVGRAFIAVRDGDLSAEILGVNLTRYKLYSFAIASGFAGLAGSLFAYKFLALTPFLFELPLSIQLLAALVIGGSASTLGPVFGAIFIVMVPEIIKSTLGLLTPYNPTIIEYTAPASTMAYGLLIIGFMMFESQGLVAIWRRFWRFVNLWPFSP